MSNYQQHPSNIEVRYLPLNSNLLPILGWIQDLQGKYKITNDQVIVGLDYDGTISNLLHGVITPKDDPIWSESPATLGSIDRPQNNLKNQWIRGGKDSRKFIKELNDNKYYWFIFSARAYSVEEVDNIRNSMITEMKLPFPAWFCKKTNNSNSSTSNDTKTDVITREFNYRTFPIEPPAMSSATQPTIDTAFTSYEHGNIVGVVRQGTPFAFDKDVAEDYAICLYFRKHKPRLRVFVDDNSDNILLMIKHYTFLANHGTQEDRNAHYLIVFIYPQKDVKLQDALTRLQITQGLL